MKTGQRGWLGLSVLAVALLVPAGAQAATADLAISKSDSPDPVAEGAVLTYTITVSNLGPGAASGVTVTDDLSSHVDFVSATASQGSCDRDGRHIRCALGELAVSEYTGATVTIKVKPTKTGQLSNSASVAVGKNDTDPVDGNNSDTETTTVTAAGGGGGGGGATCAGQAATIVGTGGADTLVGTAKRDVIKARGGNDTVRGLKGNDIACGGGGKDIVKGGSGNDRLKGGSGRDLLKGGGGDDDLFGGPGRDRCRGGAGHDTKHSC
jgi:uncharacterized repeat protein (TIGR01451 family)